MSFEEYKNLLGVDRFIRDELTALDAANAEQDREPEVTFSVRLPYTSSGELENLAEYFGDKKTPFASRLLQAAISQARISVAEQEAERGNGDAAHRHLTQRIHHEDGGWSESSAFVPPLNGKGDA